MQFANSKFSSPIIYRVNDAAIPQPRIYFSLPTTNPSISHGTVHSSAENAAFDAGFVHTSISPNISTRYRIIISEQSSPALRNAAKVYIRNMVFSCFFLTINIAIIPNHNIRLMNIENSRWLISRLNSSIPKKCISAKAIKTQPHARNSFRSNISPAISTAAARIWSRIYRINSALVMSISAHVTVIIIRLSSTVATVHLSPKFSENITEITVKTTARTNRAIPAAVMLISFISRQFAYNTTEASIIHSITFLSAGSFPFSCAASSSSPPP